VQVTENVTPPLRDVGGDGWRGHLHERTHVAYRPGVVSAAWLTLTPTLTLEVLVTGGPARKDA